MISSHSSSVCRLAVTISGAWQPLHTRITRSCSGAGGKAFGGSASALAVLAVKVNSSASNSRLLTRSLNAADIAQQEQVGQHSAKRHKCDVSQGPGEGAGQLDHHPDDQRGHDPGAICAQIE